MMPVTICVRPCRRADLRILLGIYREGFEQELTFFFRRFCRCFFQALFRYLAGDTIVAEVNNRVVGFIVVVPGSIPATRAGILQLMSTLPTLLLAVRSSFFIYVLQKVRNMDWSRCHVGIGCVAVKKDFRGKGIGASLMREALARYPKRDAVLDVRPWNESAIRLYSSAGFERMSAWRDPLGEWIIMSRPQLSRARTEPETERFNSRCVG